MFEDERGAPRHPVTCDRCNVRVLVKKHSLAHTTVQWTRTTDVCQELPSGGAPRPPAATCTLLRDSIEAAVRARLLEVTEDAAHPAGPVPISGNLPDGPPGPA